MLVVIHKLLGASVLGDSLGALRHSMFGQLSWEEKAHSSLDLTGCNGGPAYGKNLKSSRHEFSPLVVVCQLASFCSNPLKQVVDKRVHDGHSFG